MRALFVFSGLLFYFSAFSQNAIRFAYDALGNRVKREIVLQNSDVTKRKLPLEEKKEDNFYSDMLSEKQIRIWPNPTEGHLKVEIQGLAPEEKASLRITSMSGAVVDVKETTSPVSELDLSHCTNGIYLLHIATGGQETTWKIIKK